MICSFAVIQFTNCIFLRTPWAVAGEGLVTHVNGICMWTSGTAPGTILYIAGRLIHTTISQITGR